MSPLSGACDNGQFPNATYEHFGIKLPASLVPPDKLVTLTFEQIKDEIDIYHRPIEPFLEWTNGGSHVILVTGFSSAGKVYVMDPWFGEKGLIDVTELQQAYGLGRWSGTYSGFTKR